MTRRLFKLVALLSLVSCGVLGVAWVGSYARDYQIPWDALAPGRAGWRVESMEGSLFVRHVSPPAPVTPATRPPRGMAEVPETGYGYVAGGTQWLGGLFTTGEWGVYGNGTAVFYREYRVRYGGAWLLTVPLAAAAALRAWRRYEERREARRGLCRRCGYDLRATPDRCPECGAAASVSSSG